MTRIVDYFEYAEFNGAVPFSKVAESIWFVFCFSID